MDKDQTQREEAKDPKNDESSVNIRTWIIIAGMVTLAYFVMALSTAFEVLIDSFISGR